MRVKAIKAVFEPSPDYICAKALTRVTSSSDISDVFHNMELETQEYFIALHLDTKNRITCTDIVSSGSMTASIVHPREVFKSALLSSASAVIFVHNHPSGDCNPSMEDRELTARLVKGGKLLGIRVLDHVILGENQYFSFADKGLLMGD